MSEILFAGPEHFPNVILHEYVIMPNYVHGILEIISSIDNDRAIDAKNLSPIREPEEAMPTPNLKGTSKTIGSIVRGFKIGVTKWMRQNTSVHDVWQRSYFEK